MPNQIKAAAIQSVSPSLERGAFAVSVLTQDGSRLMLWLPFDQATPLIEGLFDASQAVLNASRAGDRSALAAATH